MSFKNLSKNTHINVVIKIPKDLDLNINSGKSFIKSKTYNVNVEINSGTLDISI